VEFPGGTRRNKKKNVFKKKSVLGHHKKRGGQKPRGGPKGFYDEKDKGRKKLRMRNTLQGGGKVLPKVTGYKIESGLSGDIGVNLGS